MVGTTAVAIEAGVTEAVAEGVFAIPSSSVNDDADAAGRCKIAMTATAPENACSAVAFLSPGDPRPLAGSDEHSLSCGGSERVGEVEPKSVDRR